MVFRITTVHGLHAASIGFYGYRLCVQLTEIFESKGWKEVLEKADIKVNISEFIGSICKWVLVIVSLFIAVDILGLEQFSILLKEMISYLPNILVAVLIFVCVLPIIVGTAIRERENTQS